MRILLLSAYDADSHRRFRRGLVAAFPWVDWVTVALPPRHFAWRASGNALALADRVPRQSFDRLLACGPVDLAALRGLRPDLAALPTVLYLHEHEFGYPPNPREQGRVDRQFRQILALLAADRVAVNSRFNARTLLAGAEALLEALPDAVPAGTAAALRERLQVLPVPLEDDLFERESPDPRAAADADADADPGDGRGVASLVWNHRWEWDKGPDRLPHLVDALRADGRPFRLHLVGHRFRRAPPAFDALAERLPEGAPERGRFGTVDSTAAYRDLLRGTDLVLSTALHEFQGLAVLEAVALGCVPCVPDRLAYPEWIDAAHRAASHPDDPVADGRALAALALALLDAPRTPPDVSHLSWSTRRPDWAALLELPPA